MNRKTGKLAIAAALAALLASTIGCSSGEGKSADGDPAGTAIIDRGEDGGKTVLSNAQEWPAGLPAEIPRPEGMTVTASVHNDESGNITVAVETKQPFDEVLKLYKDFAAEAGYETTIENGEEGYHMFTGARGEEFFTLTIQKDAETGLVTGAIVYSKKP